jgi:hypothetical protein
LGPPLASWPFCSSFHGLSREPQNEIVYKYKFVRSAIQVKTADLALVPTMVFDETGLKRPNGELNALEKRGELLRPVFLFCCGAAGDLA